MDQYDYLTRDQLISLIRVLGTARGGERGQAAGDADGLPEFGGRARRDFENSSSPMRIFDHETLKYLAVNDAAVKFYGYSREEFLAMNLRDTRHPDEHDLQLASLREASGYLRYGKPRRQLKKSGEIAVVEVVTQDILFNGRKARLTLTMDITGRLRMQELLWQRQQEFESLAENLPDLVARFDGRHCYVYINSAVEKLLGVARHEVLGKTQRELGMPEELVSKFERSLDEALGAGEPHALEFSMATAGGERSFEAYHVPERDGAGQIATVLCVARDITERKRTEIELTRQKYILSAIIDNLPVGVFIRDAKTHHYVMRNRFVQNRFVPGGEGAVGKTIHDLFPDEQVRRFLESDRRLFETGRMEEFPDHRVTDRQTGATRIQHVRKVPLYDENGQPWLVMGVADDITERKEAELAARSSTELSQLLESLARAANEALTPEAAMVACLELICRHGRWVLGRVEMFDRGRLREAPGRSVWHAPEGNRFDEFIRITEDHVRVESGPFIGRVLRERTAVWIEDWRQKTGYRRWAAAVRHGLRSAFAFPIIAGGEVVAVMEVFGEEARPQDPHIMGAAQSIASQLARIVEREWAHQADARMAAIVESSQDAIVSRTLDGTILTWNPGAEQLFGYTAAEIVGRNIETLWPPELTADMRRRHTLLVRGVAGPAYETVRVAKDGRRVHVSTSPVPIRDSSGNVCGVSTIVRDISERKIAERNLSESRERLEWVLDATGIGLWLNPLPLSELNWDSRTCELFFLPPGARPTAEWFWERLHPEDREPTRLAVEAALRDRTLYAIDHRVVNPKTGEIRWIRSAGKAIYDASGTAIRFDGINYDITDEKQAESERLDHTVRQRDALVREVHHRIKNSLQGVVGLLRQKIRKNPSITPDIEETISQLQSVALVYGLQETRPDGLLNLADITDAICSSAGNLIGGRLERIFERESQGPACVLAREAVSVAVALNELVINALKHQPARAGKKHVRLVLRETGDEAEIRIVNRGQLPAGFDYHGGRAAGNGLELVRTLLAAPGGTVTFNGARGEVEVVLKLSPPLLAERQGTLRGKR